MRRVLDDIKKRTMNAYDNIIDEVGSGYDDYFESVARYEAEAVLAALGSERRVLDLGCGVGTASSYFSQHGCTVVSADLSNAMLRACRARGLDGLVRLDLEALPFRHNHFDAVWAHTSLIHLPKRRLSLCLREISKLLRIGGVLFVALREGQGEGYEDKSAKERWFSNFEIGEFEGYVPVDFRIMRKSTTSIVSRSTAEQKSRLFLNYHLARSEEI